MQLWRAARSSPGTSCMKARLVRLRCFVLTILLQKSLASSSIWSTLFRRAYELLCLWMLREGIELFHRWPRKLRENSGDEGKEFTFAAELKFVRYISRQKIFEKFVYMTSLCGVWWCSSTTYMASAFLKVEKSSSWKTVTKGEIVYVRVHLHRIAQNEY